MLRHLFKLIWKRKGRNVMLSLEIMLAFIVVFAIAAIAVRNVQLYRMPTGFSYADVWSVAIKTSDGGSGAWDAGVYDKFTRALEALPGVRQVAFADSSPYTNTTSRIEFTRPDRSSVVTDMMLAGDGVQGVLGVTLEQGRWFDRTDDGAAAAPVVVSRRMAATLFGAQAAVGQVFDASGDDKHPEMMKVVGVVGDFRKNGELMSPVNFTIVRFVPGVSKERAHIILLKVAPGTTRDFETALNARLKLVQNDWTYEAAPLPQLRRSMLREKLTPLAVLTVIAGFLLLMVAFGLFGVLWQNTTRRIPEIGLRRAVGASTGHIYRQIIAEQFLLSSLAMAVALLLLVQLPVTGALGDSLNWTVFAGAAALSMAAIYLLSLLCSVYPGWRASRLSPVQALRYE